jgi:hypothetical protein
MGKSNRIVAKGTSSGARGIAREQHFKNGGSLTDWRGSHRIQDDQSKVDNKYCCRNFDDYDDFFDPENNNDEYDDVLFVSIHAMNEE